MKFECNFGTLRQGPPPANPGDSVPFRIAILGDFSGRALSGKLDTGAALAKLKPLRVDVDNLDDIIERMKISITLPLAGVGGDSAEGSEKTVELEIGSMDDFHPDELFDKLEVFEELASLRQRLGNDRTYKAAAAEVRGWSEDADEPPAKRKRRKRASRATTVPAAGKLGDFAKLIGKKSAGGDGATDVDELLRSLVTPYVTAAPDPDRDQLIDAVDASLSAAMRAVLHQSEFQSLEAIWRGVDLLVRRLETSRTLQIVLYDISAEELASDLSGADDLESTGLYKLLVEQPALDTAQGAIAAILGYYQFDETPTHAELLGRIAKIAAAANAPFVASIDKRCLDREPIQDRPREEVEAWAAVKQLPEAKYLALTVPQFLLRLPYGKKSDPIDAFAFEEFTPQTGVSGMLWGNGVLLVGLMLGQTFAAQGRKKMRLGSILSFDDMPYHYWTDSDGDQVALPCTDRLLSHKVAETVRSWGYIPLLSLRGQPAVRLGGAISLAGVELAGSWPDSGSVEVPEAASKSPAGKAGDAEWRDDLRWSSDDDDSFSFGSDDDDDDSGFGSSDSSDDSSDLSSLLSDDSDSSSSDDADTSLEALMAQMSADDSDSSSSDDADTSLDALLAQMSADDSPSDSSDDSAEDGSDDSDGMDPELAKLLADL